MEKIVVKQWIRDLIGEPLYNSPKDPKVMYAFRGMYDTLLDSAAETILALKCASLSIAESDKGDEHKQVANTWNIPFLVKEGYWHDFIRDMSKTKTKGTLESIQEFLERLQELLHQHLDQMKKNNIEMQYEFKDDFITQLNDLMTGFHTVSTTTRALLESFRKPATPTPEPDHDTRAERSFSVSPLSHEEPCKEPCEEPGEEPGDDPERHAEPCEESEKLVTPVTITRIPTSRRHRLQPHRVANTE